MKFNSPSEKLIKTFFDVNHKDQLNTKLWEKEFKEYLKQLLSIIYKDNSHFIELCITGHPTFFKLWKRAFCDETADALLNYEPLEWYGDSVYSYAFSRFVYARFADDENRSSKLFSDLGIYFKSNEFQIEISQNLNFVEWIIKGDRDVVLTTKMKGNLVESFFGALDFITRGAKNLLLGDKKFESACTFSTGTDACYIFLKEYFEKYGFDEKKGQINNSIAYFNKVSDIFGSKQDIQIIKGDYSGTFFKFFITESLIENLKSELKLSKKNVEILEYLNQNEFFKEDQTDKNKYAHSIRINIFEQKFGLTESFLEEYKDFSKIDTIPEPYKTKLIEKVKGTDRYVKIKFIVPKTQQEGNTVTVVMQRLQGDDKGKIVKGGKKNLDIITGEFKGTGFPYALRDELVKKYLRDF